MARKMENFSLTAGIIFLASALPNAGFAEGFNLNEATITSIRDAVLVGDITCEAVVKSYIKRIAELDNAGDLPINSIIALNPNAIEEARSIDVSAKANLGPLACAPLVIKDNIDIAGLPTTAGSDALRDNIPQDDATQVARLRTAGAIILAKANLAEFAWSPDYSESSLGGLTRNPYDLERTTGGSSGGTAAALAANFGVGGLGTDTGASIRGPAALQNLVGLRPTVGASSRDGVIPIWLSHDTLGPMARTVTDVALLYEATAGFDPKDISTFSARDVKPFVTADVLSDNILQGLRIGVMRKWVERKGADNFVLERFEAALSELRAQGAIIVDLYIPELEQFADLPWPNTMEYDFNQYLESMGEIRAVRSFSDVIASKKYLPELEQWALGQLEVPNPQENEAALKGERDRSMLKQVIVDAMKREYLGLIVYPTWTQPPRKLNELSGDGGNNNPIVAQAGLPAITVPMGDTPDGLPTGLQFSGYPFSEALLIGAAYDYEAATHHRRAPSGLPNAILME